MSPRARFVATATVVGVIAGAVGVTGGILARRALDDGPEPVDGEFVLDEPGIFQQPTDAVNPDTSGDALPDVVLTDVDGVPVTLDAYSGRPLIVNVWFSRCAPCRRELRDFAEVHAEVGDRIQFVGIDPFDTVATMQEFAAERGVVYDLLRDPEREFTNAMGIIGYPVTLFVDADGRILRQTGVIDADGLRSAIEELY
jgi:peroxiredoxin